MLIIPQQLKRFQTYFTTFHEIAVSDEFWMPLSLSSITRDSTK